MAKKSTWGGRRTGAGRKAEMKDSQHLAVHVPKRVVSRLQREAKKAKMPLSKYARDILATARPDLPWG